MMSTEYSLKVLQNSSKKFNLKVREDLNTYENHKILDIFVGVYQILDVKIVETRCQNIFMCK